MWLLISTQQTDSIVPCSVSKSMKLHSYALLQRFPEQHCSSVLPLIRQPFSQCKMTKHIARQSFHNISMTSMAADNYTIQTVTTVASLAATVAQQDNEAFAGVLAMARFGTANRRHGQKRKRKRLAKKQKKVTKDSDSEEKKKKQNA